MAFSTEKTLQKIRKYGSKSYIKEDRATAEERLEHDQNYYLDHEDEARAKYQAYLQQAQAEQAARDAQKQAAQDYSKVMQFVNAQNNPLQNIHSPVELVENQYKNPVSAVDRLARQAPYVSAEIRVPYQLEDEDPAAKAKELSHYEDVMSGRDENQKTLSRYETNRYIGIKKLDLSKDAQKALDDYKQGHDLIKSGTDTNVGNEAANSALPYMYWDNSGKGQKDIDAGRKLEEDARKKLKAAGMSDEDITSWLGKDDNDYKNSMLGFQDDYALEEEQSKDIDREVNDSSAKGTWNRLYGTVMTSLGSPMMNVAKGVNAMTTRPAKKGLNTSRGYGTVTDFDQFRQNTADYYRNRYGKAGEFLYNAAASTMDSATNAATFGTLASGLSNKLTTALGAAGKVKKAIDFGNAMLGSAGFAASSYADAYKDALDRGLDEKSARKTAIFNGAMEGITEAVSLDNVWDIAKTSGTKAARSALVDFLMQSGIEGSEEGAGDIADRIYDDLANGGMSEYNQNVRGYIKDGLSEKEAKSKANKDWWKQTGLDILAGSISGAVMGGGTHVLYSKANAEQAKAATSNFSPEDFGTLADNIESESNGYTSNGAKKYLGDAAKAARDISDVMKNGQNPSNSLYAKLQESMDEAESIEADKREETKAQEKKNAANTPVEEDYHYRFQLDHPTLTPEEQQRQKAMQSAIQSGIDNANVSDKYKIETTHLGDREGYQEMYNAANSSSTAEDKLSVLGRVYNDMKHSTDAGARANAESYYQLFTAQLGVSDEQARQAKATTQDAYLAGKRGDTQFAALNAEQKAAYNEGAQDYLKSRSASSVSDAENLRHAAVSLDSGAAKIDSIADIHTDNGERSVSVKLDNGKTVNLNDVQFSDRGAGVLYDYMSHLGTKEEMQSFLDNYSPDQQAGRYANAFSEMYRSGALDTAQGKADFDKAYKALPESYKVMFGEDQLRSIYNSGANETSEQYIKDMENQRKTVARKGTGKLYIRDEGHNLQEIADDDNSKAYMPLLRAYAAATKTDIIVADDIDDNINGMYDSAMQRIVLNANNESALYSTVFHEGVGEVLQAYNAKGAQKVRSVLLQYVADTKGKKYVQNIAQKYQNAYTPVEATKSYSDAVGEAMNDAISGIFSTKEGIHDFEQWMEKKEGAKKTQNVLEKLADHFKDVAESMRNLLNSGKLSKPAEDVAAMAEKRASKVRKMILDELDTAIENAQNAKVDEGEKDSIAFSVNISDNEKNQISREENRFKNQLAQWDGNNARIHFTVSRTPEIIKNVLGLDDADIQIDSSKIIKIYNKHPEMRKLLYRIPEILHDPVIIMDSLTVRGSYVFAGNVFDNNGNPVIVSLLPHPINRNGYQLDVHKITSAYAKDNAQHMLNKSKIEYISEDKKITTAWEKRTGLQLPFENFPVGGYKTNISHREDIGNSAKNGIDNIPHVKRFSLNVPVQQTKDLIAVHNLDEEKLLADIKELGGFPAPSIAIIRQGMEHNGYGDISVLFEKDTIDPERSKYNHVYGGDAWTPTFPTVEYDINDDVFYKAREKFKALKGRIPFYLYEEALRVNNNDTGNVQYSGMDSFVQQIEQNYGIRAAYVASKGIQIDDNAKRTEVGKYDDSEVKAFEAERNTLSHIGVTGEELRKMPFNQVKQEYGDLILQAYQDRANTMDKKKAERFMEKAKSHYDGPVFVFRNMVDSIANALDYYKNGNPTHTEYERDEDAIRKQIDENIKEKDLESWIRDTYEGLVADKGISNGVDPYTPSGNRRSFRATHYALTLDNVVRAMREQQAEKGANALTETGFTAVSTKDFKNIDDIHANEDSIQSLSEEEYKSLRKNIDDKVDEIANRIKNTRSEYDLSYLTVIADAARARHTAKGIESYLRNAGMKVYEGVGQEILDLKQEASMLPARYFEAKPMRAVGLDEIADVIAPDTVSDELKQALENNNIPYELYKAGDNADRTQKMNAHENLRFSINVDNEGNQLSSDQQNYFKDSKVRDDEGNLLVMYHGTPQGGFTKFRNGLTYFTSNPEYAQEYEGKNPQRGQQSNPQIYKVYLNITHPFDTRNAADRKLFINQYVKGGYALGIDPYGGETGLSENGLPDWNEADNIYDFLEENDLLDKYDGMVIDEAGSARGSDGFSYVTFKPNQAKNVDNVHPTSNDDIRYSLNIDDDLDAVFDDDLDAPFGGLKESGIRGEDVLKEGEEALGSIHVSAADTYRLAQKIVSDYGLSGQTRALNSDLQKVFAYMEKNKGNLNTRILNGVINDLARPYIDSITETVGSGEYDDIMSSLGEYEVSLTDKQLAEVKSAFGSLAKFKSVVKGSIRINQNANTNLDQAWASICDSVPGQLDVDTAKGDEPLAIADLIDAARPVQKSVFDGETADEMAQDMSLAIMKSYYDYASKNAVNKQVQKKAAKVSARLQKKQTDMRAKMRARYNERLIKARKNLRKHFNDRITALRGKDSERLAKTKANLQEKYKNRISDIRQKDAEKLDATKEAMRDQQTIRLGELKAADLEKMAALKAKNKKKWQAAAEARRALHERQQIDKHWTSLFNMLDNPTDNKHIPKALRRIVMDLLDSIDQDHPYIKMTADGKYRLRILDHIDESGKYIYQTRDFDTRENAILAYRAAVKLGMGSKANKDWQAMMSRLDDLYRAAENGAENDDALNDFVRNLDPDIAEDFHEIVSNKDAVSTALLSSDQLHTINRVLRNVESAVNQYNRMITDNTAEISSIAEPIIDHSYKVRGRKDHTLPVTIALDFVSLENATPDTFFTGMGDGGQKLYKMLLNAMDTKTHDIRQASEYMYGNGSKANGAYTSGVLAGVNLRELNSEWTGSHATVHNFESATGNEVASEGSDTVSMTTAQVMSLYELSKRQQAMLHTQGGIRVDAINGKHQDVRYLTPDAIERITSTLTKEQKSAADAMQKFMAVQAAKWGNAASNKMFGYDKFTEEHYFPITTDKTTVRTNNNSVNNEMINSIRNMGMTKQVVPGADNPIVIKDIFDVFAGHINDMATYHAYAPAIQDLIRVYDYKVKEDIPGGFVQSTTVKNAIQKLYGDSGNKYMVNLVKSLNNAEKSNYTITNLGLLGKNYRAAAVGGNLRVVMQQPMAWFRAGMEVDYKYLNQGLLPNADADRMREETSDMYWAKSQGNVDGIVTKGFKQQITGAESTKDKLVNMSMALAGKADDVTWAALYRGVFAEQKVAFEKAGKAVLNNGEYTKAFKDAVNGRFDDMISRTQVIDGTLFRSNIMRSNDGLVQFMTSFMAEPTKTYNMFLREAMNISQNGASKEAMKRVAKAAVVFTITQMATALAQSVADAFRRDDDDQKWYEVFLDAYMDNLRDNMNVFQLLPGVKDVWSMIENAFSDENYSSSGFYEQQSISALIDTVQQDIKYINNARSGEEQSKTRYGIFMSNMRALANFTGIPIYNMSRTAAEIYNEMNDLWGGENLYKTTKSRKAHYKNVLIEAVENNDDVEKALQDYIDAGGKASSAISTEQKNAMKQEYIDAYNAGDTKTMKRIEKSTSPIFEAERKAKQEKAKENGEKVPEDFNADEYYNKWVSNDVKQSVFDAIDNGSDYRKAIEGTLKHGLTYQSIESAITSQYKDKYLQMYQQDRGSVTKLKNRLNTVYEYLDQKEGQKKPSKRKWLDDPAKYLKEQKK